MGNDVGGEMAAIRQVLIDDVTWESATPERRRDVRVAIDDLLAEHRFDLPEPEVAGAHQELRLLVTDTPGRVTFDLVGPVGTLVAQASLTAADLHGHLGEYLATCREMVALGDNSPRLEALDIAKRLIHDEAAETIAARCRVLRPSHATARRLFTLIVTLREDTTRL